jgi:integrase
VPVPYVRKTNRVYAKAKRLHFTDTNVLSLSPDKSQQYLIWDEGTGSVRGLTILVSPRGGKSYRMSYYYEGSPKAHWKNLGRVDAFEFVEEARDAARKVLQLVRQGRDPNAGEPIKVELFQQALDLFFRSTKARKGKKRSERSAQISHQFILKHCAPWLKRPVASIRQSEVNELLEALLVGDDAKGIRGKPYASLRLHAHLTTFYTWCVGKQYVTQSPLFAIEKPWDGAAPRERPWFEGKPANDAIKSLWRCADQLTDVEGKYLRMLLLTGKRKTPIAKMRWEEIDDSWFWNAPKSDIDNKRLHPIPLPALAKQILGRRQATGAVFDGINPNQNLQNKIRKLTGIDTFIFHGTRHVAETKLAELRVPTDIRDRLFDHAPKRGSGKHYDKYLYKDEMRAALTLWGDHILSFVAPPERHANVTPLRRRGAKAPK